MPSPEIGGVVAVALAAVRRRLHVLDTLPDAASREDVRRDTSALVDAVEAVLLIHHPSRLTVGGYICAKCLDAYPCNTVQTLEHHLRAVSA